MDYLAIALDLAILGGGGQMTPLTPPWLWACTALRNLTLKITIAAQDLSNLTLISCKTCLKKTQPCSETHDHPVVFT